MRPPTWWFCTDAEDFQKVVSMGIVGLMGGLVRVCSEPGKPNWRTVVAALLTSAFSGSLAAAVLHHKISDPVYLGAVCSMFGYLGQSGLNALLRYLQRFAGVRIKGGK